MGDELCTQGAGFEVLCDIHRIPERNYAYCHFRGPDGATSRQVVCEVEHALLA